MNDYELRLAQRIDDELVGRLTTYTPGLRLQVAKEGQVIADLSLGKAYRYYDLASLTKIMFTVSAYIDLFDQGKVQLKTSVSDILDWWPHRSVKIKDLLNHSAGLPWWKPFFRSVDRKASREKRWEQLARRIAKLKPQKSARAVYSDVDFLLLGFCLEKFYGQKLEVIWRQLRSQMKIPHTHFNINNKPHYERKHYAPTENSRWRNKTLRGEVHDDNTWALGGVSSHAGLFGPIDDVMTWALELRNGYYSRSGSRIGSQSSIRHFTRRSIPTKKGDWALGFMMPTKGAASCGRYFSSRSVGHTGFTGTSLWFDPVQDLIVVILSNRVHPTRRNKKFVGLRPLLHDWIVEEL